MSLTVDISGLDNHECHLQCWWQRVTKFVHYCQFYFGLWFWVSWVSPHEINGRRTESNRNYGGSYSYESILAWCASDFRKFGWFAKTRPGMKDLTLQRFFNAVERIYPICQVKALKSSMTTLVEQSFAQPTQYSFLPMNML